MRSLQSRLSAGLLATLAVLSLALVVSGGYAVHRITETFIAGRVEHELETLLSGLSLDAQGRPVLDTARLGPVFERPYSGHYFRIVAPAGELRSRSLWDAELPLAEIEVGTLERRFTAGPDQQELIMLTRRVRLGETPVDIAVTEDIAPLEHDFERLAGALAGLAAALTLALLAVQRWVVRRALAPLETVRRDLQRLAEARIAELPTTVPAELRPLVDEINRLSGLVVQRLQRSRNALGNLAHALKTPLTLLTQLERHPAIVADPALQAAIALHTHQIHELIQRELRRARIAGSPSPGRRVDLAREAADLVATLTRIHRERAPDIRTQIAAGCTFPGDRDDLLELLGNLLDNACQWARSGVELSAEDAAGELVLRVEDDGPGVAEATCAALAERGRRLDESRDGSGLGLAIVGDIVEQYGGRLRLGRSPALGGFLAEVALPHPGGS